MSTKTETLRPAVFPRLNFDSILGYTISPVQLAEVGSEDARTPDVVLIAGIGGIVGLIARQKYD